MLKKSFPSRISWLRAIALISTRITLSLLLSETLNQLPRGSTPRTLINLGAWVGFSMLMGVWSHCIFVFQGKTKLWKPKQHSIREAVDALKISFVSDLIAIGLVIVCIALGYTIYGFSAPFREFTTIISKDPELFFGITGLILILVWFISIPFLYQHELVKRSRPKTKKPTKSR